ncbi:IS1595 family transposase [Candidatus Kaiserbacteria bacterium]|nr:IS1595 family transposase [Candidatus Kaiserbacteria bacterium]
MARINKYTIKDLKAQFSTEDVCLDFIFDALHSRKCSCGGEYRRVKARKQYQCSKCRFQIAPTAGTIFHKSDTPLTGWFYALFIFSNAKSGISAKELERQIGVTYKCAWRMHKQIRSALGQDKEKLTGDVEMDTGYFGGRFRAGTDNHRQSEAMAAKSVVMGAVSRGGKAKLKVVPNAGLPVIEAFLESHVSKDALLMTDNAATYKSSSKVYRHLKVNHSKKEYAWDRIHINTIETFFAHLKRSIAGTHKTISKEHLQSYLDAFVFHRNNSGNDSARFAVLLGAVLRGAR